MTLYICPICGFAWYHNDSNEELQPQPIYVICSALCEEAAENEEEIDSEMF